MTNPVKRGEPIMAQLSVDDIYTELVELRSKQLIKRVNSRIDMKIGDKIVVEGKVFIVQSNASIREHGYIEDKERINKDSSLKKLYPKKRKIEYTYTVAVEGTGKDLHRYDLKDAKTIKL
jgi:hypothetical protein